jgi:hypothetical protein
MRTLVFALVASLLVPLSTLSSQQQSSIEPGARVRVKLECTESYTPPPTIMLRTICPTHTGTVTALAADSIILETGAVRTRTAVPIASVTRLEVSQWRKSFGFGKGMLYGLLIGGGGGALVGALYGTQEDIECGLGDHLDGPCPELKALFGVVLAGVPGTVIGGVVGALVKTEGWEEVPLDRLRVRFAPQRDGRFAVGLSFAF